MGFIKRLRENQSGTIVFPLRVLEWHGALSLRLAHTSTKTPTWLLHMCIYSARWWISACLRCSLCHLRTPDTGEGSRWHQQAQSGVRTTLIRYLQGYCNKICGTCISLMLSKIHIWATGTVLSTRSWILVTIPRFGLTISRDCNLICSLWAFPLRPLASLVDLVMIYFGKCS